MPPLILLPGLACDAALFRDQVPGLAALGPVTVSDVHTREATLPAMARRLLAEHPGPLALAGSSMGGMLALECARQAPERVCGLALLGTSARADTPELLKLRSDAIALFEAGRMDEVLQANLMFAFHPEAVPALVGDYLAMIQRAGAGQLTAQNRAVMARDDLRPLLPTLACPLLVMVGDSDLLTPPEHSREIADAVPHARLELLPRCGHLLTWERPEAVTAALAEWWQALDQPPMTPPPRQTSPS
jgi:pimeloyl-ACP methyl ester carboxylesterase